MWALILSKKYYILAKKPKSEKTKRQKGNYLIHRKNLCNKEIP